MVFPRPGFQRIVEKGALPIFRGNLMELQHILPEAAVLPKLAATTKGEVLAELVAPLLPLRPELRLEDALAVLREREALGSTAVGEGVAIPHGKIRTLRTPALAMGRSEAGVPFDAPDGQVCTLFFLLLLPPNEAGLHLRLLAQLARRAKDPFFRAEALMAAGRTQLWRLMVTP